MKAAAIKLVAKKKVLIIGRNHMQNKLFSSFIENNTGFDCEVVSFDKIVNSQYRSPTSFDLLLLDYSECAVMRIKNTIDSLIRNFPNSKIAFFNTPEAEQAEEVAAWSEVKGIFYITTPENKLANGIKAILDGELWLPRRLISRYYTSIKKINPSSGKESGLTCRELEILRLIAHGERNKDIARSLCLSDHTIKTHIYHIYKKLNVSNRTQAAHWAQTHLS